MYVIASVDSAGLEKSSQRISVAFLNFSGIDKKDGIAYLKLAS